MGNTSSCTSRLQHAFGADGFKVQRCFTRGDGVGAIATTVNPHYMNYDRTDPQETVRNILNQTGSHKRIFLVKGSPYEMGFLLGRMAPYDVEMVCTTYLDHVSPQFLSESFDLALDTSPIFGRTLYSLLIHHITDVLVEGSVAMFWESYRKGHIPERYLEEMRGMVEGVASINITSPVTMDRIIAANYGLDYMVGMMFSGKLMEHMQKVWKRMPESFRKSIPLKKDFITAPDMCNLVFVTGSATASGQDSFLLRDFQFQNAHVYERCATLVIRIPTDRRYNAHVAVVIPGMVGLITGMNRHGLGLGVNLVRSGAVDIDNLRMGALMMLRTMAEESTTADDAVAVLRKHSLGAPWILYALDAQGERRIMEVIAPKWTDFRKHKWVENKDLVGLIPNDATLDKTRPDDTSGGVWVRSGAGRVSDEVLRTWNKPVLDHLEHIELVETSRWQVGNHMFTSWHEEQKTLYEIGNMYFPPWRTLPGISIATNAFLHPLLRLTQMNKLANMAVRTATGIQWRMDELTRQLKEQHGQLTWEKCRDIICFLSPWKQPDYPQNTLVHQENPDLQNIVRTFAETHSMEHVELTSANKFPNYEYGVVVVGSITMIDTKRGYIMNKNGYWGNDFYGVTLSNYLN